MRSQDSVDSYVQTAASRIEKGDPEAALTAFEDLFARYPKAELDAKDEQLLETCLQEIGRTAGGNGRLESLGSDRQPERIARKALLVLGNRISWETPSCGRALEVYELIETRYPHTSESYRASIGKAMKCLTAAGRDLEAISTLERITVDAKDTAVGAFALYQLGVLQSWLENRAEARVAFERLMVEYPRDLGYPDPNGMAIVKFGQTSLNSLSTYRVSPTFDKSLAKLLRTTGVAATPSTAPPAWAALGLEGFLLLAARIGVSVLVALVILLLTSIDRHEVEGKGPLLKRSWTGPRIFGLLLITGIISVMPWLLGAVVSLLNLSPMDPGSAVATFDIVARLAFVAVIMSSILWGEDLARIFGLPREQTRTSTWLAVRLLVGCVLFALIIKLALDTMGYEVVKNTAAHTGRQAARAQLGIIGGVLVTALSAVTEECLFRGVLYGALTRNMPRWIAAVASAAVFSAFHVAPIQQGVGLFILGIATVCLREASGSLLAPSLLHVMVNLVAD